jgi:hypothetical protein
MGRPEQEAAWLPRNFPLLFAKKRGAALELALRDVHDVYFPGTERQPGKAHVWAKILHLTMHSMPQQGAALYARLVAIGTVDGAWLLFVPVAMKLRCLLVACLYSLIEYTFTWLERGRPFTSVEQWHANLFFVPALEAYHANFVHSPICYVALFPPLIWSYEIVAGHLLKWVCGRNVAWEYGDYADAFGGACARVGHGPFWLGLGAVCLVMLPRLIDATALVEASA